MESKPSHSGDMSHDSERGPAHRNRVKTAPTLERAIDKRSASLGRGPTGFAGGDGVRPLSIDPAARASKRMYQGLSASSAGLELGLAVVVGVLFGMWLDRRLGTEPWLMLVFMVLGLVAGFRNVLRAVARAEKDDHE